MITVKLYEERIPEYALNYVINGNDEGLTKNDIKLVDSFISQFYQEAHQLSIDTGIKHNVIVSLESEDSFFTWTPSFGLGCTVYDCKILIVKPNKKG